MKLFPFIMAYRLHFVCVCLSRLIFTDSDTKILTRLWLPSPALYILSIHLKILMETLRKHPLKRFSSFKLVYSPEFTFFPWLESRSPGRWFKRWVDKWYIIGVCWLVISSHYKINKKGFTQFSGKWKRLT